MSPLQPLPPKKEVALALLEQSSVHLHLDPRLDGVVVPPWFKKQPQLVLQVGLNMPVPIPDLRLDEDGLSCTLSFNRAPFFCIVPWASVFAIVGDDGRGMVWPDDVPPEVAQQAPARAAAESARKEPAKRPALEPVRAEAAAPKPKRPRKKAAAAQQEAGSQKSATGTPASPARERLAPVPAAPAAAGAPAPPLRVPQPAPQQQARKPKRELPPYLRVVK